MSDELSLTLFAHVCDRPDAEIDLGEAALLLGELDHPGVDIERARAMLDDLGEGARAAMARSEVTEGALRPADRAERRTSALVRWLYDEVGFHGNQDDYYDPRNSFLDEVLARRTGIPITLAVVLMEVGRRAGLDLQGVSFPGHFLVRAETTGGFLLVDPFGGRLLSRADLRALHTRATGEEGDPPGALLAPTGPKPILVRMLSNLRSIYTANGDAPHLRAVIARMQVLAPSDELKRESERLGGSAPFRGVSRALN